MWQQWTNMILGLWVALIPFLGFGGSEKFTLTLMISGAIIVLTSSWSLLTREEESEAHRFHESPLW
ncbi:MAG TPA: SPW repeat protein [Candidatus Paceibacterota bacterium]